MLLFEWWYISYMLILISIIVSLVVWQNKWLFRYGFNKSYYLEENYAEFAKQVGFFQFIHGDILHLVMNSYFLYMVGPTLERAIWTSNFLIFFLSTTLVTVFALSIFAPKSNTIGISWFCMALLSYLWIALYTIGDPDATQIGTLLIINIAFWFVPGISPVWHASGAAWGIAFWYITRTII